MSANIISCFRTIVRVCVAVARFLKRGGQSFYTGAIDCGAALGAEIRIIRGVCGVGLGYLRRGAAMLHGLPLQTDLARDIGSWRWWRSLSALAILVYASFTIGTRPAPILSPTAPLSPEQQQLAGLQHIAPLALGSEMGDGATGTSIAPTMVATLSAPPEKPRIDLVARVAKKGGVMAALERAGVSAEDRAAFQKIIPADTWRNAARGTLLYIRLGRRADKSTQRPLERILMRAAFDQKIELWRGENDAFYLKYIPVRVSEAPLRVSGRIENSLYQDAMAAGLPMSVTSSAVRALAYTVDLRRLRSGDRFDFVVESRRAETGETETGDLIYAALHGVQDVAIMRWTDRKSGEDDFFLQDGTVARKGLMRTPVEGARLTSGFGFRLHPVLGYSRLHRGVDFAAPTGTPILAAANGTVERASRNGGYGKYVRIRHNSRISSGYAHLSRYNVRAGQRVKQGQVIGYVGSTGLSTGPHLHYEVYLNGKPVNPHKVKFSGSNKRLVGEEFKRFKTKMQRLRQLDVAQTDGRASTHSGDG